MNNLLPDLIQVVDRYPDGKDSFHFTFSLPEHLHDTPVDPGQFFMLSVPGVEEAPFTYVTCPNKHGLFDVLIRKMGKLTNKLIDGQLKQLGYRGPFGVGWPIEKCQKKNVLVIAGGCGLAPLANFINQRILEQQFKQTVVIYGTLDKSAQILSRERSHWQTQLSLIETLEHTDDDTNASERPTDKIHFAMEQLGESPDVILTCGPEAMMTSTAKILVDEGIKANQIYLSMERRMRCGVGTCGHCFIGSSYCCTDGPAYSWQQLINLGFNRGTKDKEIPFNC
jgi:anaerobic sulfite reductase subunit B